MPFYPPSLLLPVIVFFSQNFTNLSLVVAILLLVVQTVNMVISLSVCLPVPPYIFLSLSHELAHSFSALFSPPPRRCRFLPYLSITAFIYLRMEVSDDCHPAQCLAQADKVYGCVMECSAQQPGSDVNKLIF